MTSRSLSGVRSRASVLRRIASAVAVVGMAVALRAGPVDSARLLEDANCIACHTPSAAQSEWLVPRAAPRWKELGDRVSPAWLKAYLADPRGTHPGTAMPHVLHGFPTEARAEVAEALTHFLMADRPQGFNPVLPDRAAVARGEGLFHSVGCVACHPPQNGAAAAVRLVQVQAQVADGGAHGVLAEWVRTW